MSNTETDPLAFRTKFHELLSNFLNYETIFTDGSKDGDTLDQPVLLHLIHKNLDYLTMHLFFQRRSKPLI